MVLDNRVSEATMDSYLGLNINEICSNGYNDASLNHCAHFVSHVMDFRFGETCRAQVVAKLQQAPGANLRVHEVFAHCPEVEELLMCPTHGSALIFVSDARNFGGMPVQLSNVRNKHIGVLVNGRVWHYSNSRDAVVVQPAAEFLQHYKNQTNALWLGALPQGTTPQAFSGLACRAG